jgi:hypothetical protein
VFSEFKIFSVSCKHGFILEVRDFETVCIHSYLKAFSQTFVNNSLT